MAFQFSVSIIMRLGLRCVESELIAIIGQTKGRLLGRNIIFSLYLKLGLGNGLKIYGDQTEFLLFNRLMRI